MLGDGAIRVIHFPLYSANDVGCALQQKDADRVAWKTVDIDSCLACRRQSSYSMMRSNHWSRRRTYLKHLAEEIVRSIPNAEGGARSDVSIQRDGAIRSDSPSVQKVW